MSYFQLSSQCLDETFPLVFDIQYLVITVISSLKASGRLSHNFTHYDKYTFKVKGFSIFLFLSRGSSKLNRLQSKPFQLVTPA